MSKWVVFTSTRTSSSVPYVEAVFSQYRDFSTYQLSFAEQHPEMKWYEQPDPEIPNSTTAGETVFKIVCEFPTQELYDQYMSDSRNIKTIMESLQSNSEISEYLSLNNQTQTVEIFDSPVDLTGLVEVNIVAKRLLAIDEPVPTE